jgi:hypothetical protein
MCGCGKRLALPVAEMKRRSTLNSSINTIESKYWYIFCLQYRERDLDI